MSRSNALSLVAAMLLIAACHSHSSPGNPSTDAPDAGVLSQLESDTGVSWAYRAGTDYGSVVQLAPKRVPAPTVNSTSTAVQAAEAFLRKYGAILGIGDFESELSLVFEPVPDASGITWVSFQQSEHDVPVYARRILVAYDPNGSIGLVWSGYVSGLQGLSVTPAQTAAQALAVAQTDITTELDAGTPGDFLGASTPELVIYPGTSASNLAYHVELAYASAARDYWIDAQSGAVLYSMDARVEAAVPALGTVPNISSAGTQVSGVSGLGSYGDVKRLTVFQSGAFDYMQQQIPGAGALWVQIIDGKTGAIPSADTSSSEISGTPAGNSPTWVAAPSSGLSVAAAVDAYQYVFLSEQWWQSNFRWKSFDNAGSNIPIVLDPSAENANNAAWVGFFGSIFVGSVPNNATPMSAALDVMGHEYTHAVNGYSLGAGSDQTMAGKALNEALADEFGQFIEGDNATATPYKSSNVTLGEGSPFFLRNLAEPHQSSPSQPNNIYDPQYTNPPRAVAYGGKNYAVDEHYFDGVPNNAWYLATFGGQNSTSNITVPNTLGWAKSEFVYGATMLAGCSGRLGTLGCGGNVRTFEDFAFALTKTTVMLYGRCHPEVQSVGCSWYAVGVLDPAKVADNFGVNACQCPNGAGTYCGTQIVYGGNPDWLYTCDANGTLTSIADCASSSQTCGSPSPSPDGTPLDSGMCTSSKSGATAGQGCGGSVTCICPLACIEGVCSALTSADCINNAHPSTGTAGRDAGCTASTAAGCGSGTVTLTYGNTQEVLSCWGANQPGGGILMQIASSMACGYTANVVFPSQYKDGSCAAPKAGAVYDLATDACISVTAGAQDASWVGMGGQSWVYRPSQISSSTQPYDNCQAPSGTVTVNSINPLSITFSHGAQLFSTATLLQGDLHDCPNPPTVGIDGTMSATLAPPSATTSHSTPSGAPICP